MNKRSLLVASMFAALSFAQRARAEDPAGAEALFNEGYALLDRGEVAAACERFAASQKLEPASGTLLSLGACWVKLGKTATAWATFREAEAFAARQGDARRAKVAHDRAADLEPTLPRLVIEVTAPAEGETVRRDGAVMDHITWGKVIPVDPGEVRVEASAEGREPWSTTVLCTTSAVCTIQIPELKTIAHPALTPPPAKPKPPSSSQGTWGWITLGAAGAGLATAVVVGFVAKGSWDSAKRDCDPEPRFCGPKGLSDASTAATSADVSTALFIASGAVAVLGSILVLTAPRARPAIAALTTGFTF